MRAGLVASQVYVDFSLRLVLTTVMHTAPEGRMEATQEVGEGVHGH